MAVAGNCHWQNGRLLPTALLAPFTKYRGLKVKVLPLPSQWSIIQDHNPNENIKKRFDVVRWCMLDLKVATVKLDRSDAIFLIDTPIFRLLLKRARDLLKKFDGKKRNGTL